MSLFPKKSPAAPALPACTLTRDGLTVTLDEETSALIRSAWETKQTLDDTKQGLDALNARLLESYGPGCVLEIPGHAKLTLTEREAVAITDLAQMRAVLGGRFEDLVESREEHKLSDKLKQILADADHPLCEPLRACVAVKSSVSVTYRPVKP